MTENLFKFVLVRPPQRVSQQEATRLTVQPYAKGFSQFAQILAQQGDGTQARPLAVNYIKSTQFVSHFGVLQNGKALAALDQWLLTQRNITVEAWRAAVQHQLPNQPDGDTSSITAALRGDCLQLADSLLALVIAREDHPAAQDVINRGLRICALIERLGDEHLTDAEVRFGLHAPVVLPTLGLNLKPPPQEETNSPSERHSRIVSEQEKLANELNSIQGAIQELVDTYHKKLHAVQMYQARAIPGREVADNSSAPSDGYNPAAAHRMLTASELCALSECTQEILSGYTLPLDILVTIQVLEGRRSRRLTRATAYCAPRNGKSQHNGKTQPKSQTLPNEEPF